MTVWGRKKDKVLFKIEDYMPCLNTLLLLGGQCGKYKDQKDNKGEEEE